MFNFKFSTKMKKKFFNLRNAAKMLVTALAATTMFAACDKPEDEQPIDPNAPVFTAFSIMGQSASVDAAKRTVKITVACGTNLAALTPEFTLSPAGTIAKIGSTAQTSGVTPVNCAAPVTYTLTTAEGVTAQWTVTVKTPDNCPPLPEKVLYSYNPPAQYYIVVKNWDERSIEFAFGNEQFARVEGGEAHYWEKSPYTSMSSYSNRSSWADYSELDKHNSDYGRAIYNLDNVYSRPCYFFNLYLCSRKANRQGETNMFPLTWDFNSDGIYELAEWETNLQNYDVTQYYVRSETVRGVACNVFSGFGGTKKLTFWVDKANGLTLKCTQEQSGETETFEITTYQLTAPNWDGLHLRPQAGDEIVEP
jgi:hypothetical protein